MQILIAFVLIGLPTFCAAEQRFGEWVTQQLGYEPQYSQSIEWQMNDVAVVVGDPTSVATTASPSVSAPNTTAWLVGLSTPQRTKGLIGMALVWSDYPFENAVALSTYRSQSGLAAFMTDSDLQALDRLYQTDGGKAAEKTIHDHLGQHAPGPFLAQLPDGPVFPVAVSGGQGDCNQVTALYQDAGALSALVVLFFVNGRDDATALACDPLLS